ncbi:protein root UVB sensitive 5 isoform X1 [Cinnamomum micranthum f. kanehirae]|uniref:Protein root UVB sensitive 5 isoform X1 n=1 Tax=Cinnamomum micranthum f. kanehirae TaxID=337451 RepID=A0A3S3MY17_9MAGN|nr:protein root UVB sensitive 5 isoform X1 [Cinnamomum micranthum f. kanehirae]
MPSSMNPSFPTFASIGRRIHRTTRQTKRNLSPTICNCSSSSDGPDEDKRLNQSRYILDDESQIQTVLEEHGPLMNGLQEENNDTELSWLPKILKEFILPAGFPATITKNYVNGASLCLHLFSFIERSSVS